MHDALGSIHVPANVYYGAETQRARDNFPISGRTPHPTYVSSIVIIKKAAALVHAKLNTLDKTKARAIRQACDELLRGMHRDHIVIDPYQAGAGTSLHMNINEVIAGRATEILNIPINPHDDVNMSQSTNDVIPTAIRIMLLTMIPKLQASLISLHTSFEKKASAFDHITKSGRTHMQDAMPITLGQEFSGYAHSLKKDMHRLEHSTKNLYALGIGGTAVGTGANTHPRYRRMIVSELSRLTKLPLKPSKNLFESMQHTADFLDVSASLRTLSYTLVRISNDLRLLSSGPRTGLNEIMLPSVQPGSSIMPGKVNPSMLEMLTMVCFQVIGFDQATALATGAGQLELNVMLPLIAHNLSEQIDFLTHAVDATRTKCIDGIEANEAMCRYWYERSVGVGALLNTVIGYDKATEVVQFAKKNNCSIVEAAVQKKVITEKQARILFK